VRLPDKDDKEGPMRHTFWSVPSLLISGVVLIAPSVTVAQERASLEGFGGLSLNTMPSESIAPSIGGTLTFSVTPGIQIVGEAGRLGNVLPTLSDAAFSLSGTGFRVSALYGEAGVRLVRAPGSVVTPYVEGTGGMARLEARSDRFGSLANAAASVALGLLDRTTPTLGGGGGILLRGGPIMFDVGYRYKHLFADDIVRFGLGFGQQLHTHQARVGIGVRF
jgi:hypothetical protein